MTRAEARQYIIDHCNPYYPQGDTKWDDAMNTAIKALEQKKGTWILREDLCGGTEAKCSECGFEMLVNEPGNGLHEVSDLHFCPNCGTDMERQ